MTRGFIPIFLINFNLNSEPTENEINANAIETNVSNSSKIDELIQFKKDGPIKIPAIKYPIIAGR